MGDGDGSAPYAARDTGEFIEAMRRLKEQSGLTYRQLEEKAAAHGDTLPRSTLANALGGRSLPRPDLLAAFVRACGAGDQAAEWTRARSLLATKAAAGAKAGAGVGTSDGAAAPTAPPSPRPGRPSAWRTALRPTALSALAAVFVLTALLLWALTSLGGGDDHSPNAGRNHPSTGAAGGQPSETAEDTTSDSATALPEGPVRIHPLSAPKLCLTEGYVPDGRYDSVVAVQRPCADVAPQRTTLVPAGSGTYRIQWYRPDQGKGCLAVRTAGPATGLLEPQDDCPGATRLRIEPAAARSDDSAVHLFRTEDGRRCVTIAAPATTEGAEAVLTPCTASKAQRFRIAPAPSGPAPADSAGPTASDPRGA
ncbi:helix-turn-helix transcriptional regulator [Streptomyces sp. Ru73]|uniref:helix-turn-helix domain-containing protein n=1 Tax=Streptomyces sp. Ru73 TaxID=2080748 RepID=UPI0015E462F6|nr:helix-turn-helix transcriptional regulator [Streptomyces sp. Ru73]